MHTPVCIGTEYLSSGFQALMSCITALPLKRGAGNYKDIFFSGQQS